jgi:hypothetical protein
MFTLPRLFEVHPDDEDTDADAQPDSDVVPASGIRGARTRWDVKGVPYDLLSQIDGLLIRQGDSQLDDLELDDYVEPTPPPLPSKPAASKPPPLPSSPPSVPSASGLGDLLAAQVDEGLRSVRFPVTVTVAESGVWVPPPSTSRRRRRVMGPPTRGAEPAPVPPRSAPKQGGWLAVSFLFAACVAIGFAGVLALPLPLAERVSSDLMRHLR